MMHYANGVLIQRSGNYDVEEDEDDDTDDDMR